MFWHTRTIRCKPAVKFCRALFHTITARPFSACWMKMRSLLAERIVMNLGWDLRTKILLLDRCLMRMMKVVLQVDHPVDQRWLFRQACAVFPWVQIRAALFVNRLLFAVSLV